MKKENLDVTKPLVIAGKDEAVKRFLIENHLSARILPGPATHYTEYEKIAKEVKGNIYSQSLEFLLTVVDLKQEEDAQFVTCFIVDDKVVTRVIHISDVRYVHEQLGLELR